MRKDVQHHYLETMWIYSWRIHKNRYHFWLGFELPTSKSRGERLSLRSHSHSLDCAALPYSNNENITLPKDKKKKNELRIGAPCLCKDVAESS